MNFWEDSLSEQWHIINFPLRSWKSKNKNKNKGFTLCCGLCYINILIKKRIKTCYLFIFFNITNGKFIWSNIDIVWCFDVRRYSSRVRIDRCMWHWGLFTVCTKPACNTRTERIFIAHNINKIPHKLRVEYILMHAHDSSMYVPLICTVKLEWYIV